MKVCAEAICQSQAELAGEAKQSQEEKRRRKGEIGGRETGSDDAPGTRVVKV